MEFQRATQLEWLETNSLGGYASATICGANTRRYHGLLVAALKPPVGRYILLSKFEETLIIAGKHFDLSTNFYEGAVYPRGFDYLTGFRADPFPCFTYQAGGMEIEKRIFMVDGGNTTVIEYAVIQGSEANATLELRPLLAFRDFHSTTHANGALNAALDIAPNQVSVQPYPDLPRLHLAHNACSIEPARDWYYNFEYPIERERGLDFREDLFCPLTAVFDLRVNSSAIIIASLEPTDIASLPALREQEISRRQTILKKIPSEDPFVTALTVAAGQFIVRRGSQHSVIAGYHWFGDWGRDTMIALPGLTLVTGRHEIARSILQAYAGYIDQGMLPNRFPDEGEAPEYNSVDAALWFIEAVRAYREHTGDVEFVRELYPKLMSIVDFHRNGTRFEIHADEDGLLVAGGPGTQLTWMDAKVGDFVPTPRHGKPVEIQALWYNAICVIAELSKDIGAANSVIALNELAQRIRVSFNRQFWNEQAGCFYDVIQTVPETSIRPNQVIALSLKHTMVSREHALRALGVIERDLLTPFGLRTLSPSDPKYRGRYEGGPAERDAIYHQGTVWPWLLGPFITAYIRAHENSPAARMQAASWLAPFYSRMNSMGIFGQVPEILDGDAPHFPRGCAAQAWSVGQLLYASWALQSSMR